MDDLLKHVVAAPGLTGECNMMVLVKAVVVNGVVTLKPTADYYLSWDADKVTMCMRPLVNRTHKEWPWTNDSGPHKRAENKRVAAVLAKQGETS